MILTDDVTRGNTRTRQLIRDFLISGLEETIPLAWTAWNLNSKTLPLPAAVQANDPLESTVYPTVGVFVTGSSNIMERDPYDNGSAQVTYDAELTLFVMTRTALLGVDASGIDQWEQPYRESAIRQRDDYIGLMRKIVHRSHSFGTAGSEYPIVANMKSWRESLDEPIKVSDSRNPMWVCSGLINVNLQVTDRSFEFEFDPISETTVNVTKLV